MLIRYLPTMERRYWWERLMTSRSAAWILFARDPLLMYARHLLRDYRAYARREGLIR